MAAAAGMLGIQLLSNRTESCGIVGFIGSDPSRDNAVEVLMEGLTILQNRGYDSAGLATANGTGTIRTTKYASVGSTSDSISLLGKEAIGKHKGDTVGIAHTRWATHGGRTDENAHPHSDMHGKIALVHNGTIENSRELKKELQEEGYVFNSQTDTEVIAQLVGKEVSAGHCLLDAVKRALTRLEGTWGLAVMCEDEPGSMIVARNGSPIVIGIGESCTYIASETTAFMRHTKNFISLKDGEIAVVTPQGLSLEEPLESRIELAQGDVVETSPAPFPHWTIKEIMEQPVAASRALGYGGRLNPEGGIKLGGLENNSERLLSVHNLLVAACGTSHFAGQYGGRLMRHLGSFDTVQNMDAAEIIPEAFPSKDAGLLCISQSGETRDVLKVLDLAEASGVPCFSIVNAVGSMIARTTGCGVYSHAGREQAVASTKAFVTQVTVLSLIAAWFSERREAAGGLDQNYAARRDRLVESLHRLPSYVGMTLQDKQRELCREVAQKLVGKETIFVLGKGFAEPIAQEGALKIKEITYCHAEGYSGGALKHGPFALIEQGTPIIMLIMDDQHAANMRTAAEEVRARGAHTIVITDKRALAKGVADDVVVVPSNGMLSSLLAVIPLQLIAYELALAKGINPDKPRNLAKAVTTD